MAVVFISQATDTPMSLAQPLSLLAVLLLTSKGSAGVTDSGFIVLAATLVVAQWCGELDTERMQSHLNGETLAEAEEPEGVLDLKQKRPAA